MYCPKCLTEYRDGFTDCADCHVPLTAGVPPQSPLEEGLQLVTVLETEDSFGLSLAKAALDDAGIDYLVTGDNPRYFAGFPGGFGLGESPLGRCSSRIQVALESESEARELLEPLQSPRSDFDEKAEPEE